MHKTTRTVRRALEGDQDFIRAVLDTVDALIIVADRDFRIVRFNRGCEALTGYSASEVVGRLVPEVLLVAEEAQATMAAFKDLRSGNFPNTFENHWRTRQGDLRRISWSSTALTDKDGNVTYVIGTGTDITNRHRAEQALRESEKKFRALAESMPQLVWIAGQDGSNLYVNQRWTDYSGLSREQSRGSGWSELIHPEDRDAAALIWQDAMHGGRDYEVESRFRRADGTYRWWLTRGVPIRDASGQVVQWFGTSTDIEDLKQAESALQLREHELALSLSRQQALSRRLVNARDAEQQHLSAELHDRIGQNLAALNINIDILEKVLAPAADNVAIRLSDSRVLVASIIASVRDLTTDMRPPALEGYGLLPGLRSLAQTIEARCGIAVTVNGDESEPRLPQWVEAGLFRIAQEALINVSKHAHAACVELTLCQAANGAYLAISDDGVGFDQAGLEQAELRSRWGLLLMQERAEALGGRLSLDSAPACGTRIVVELPKHQPAFGGDQEAPAT